MSWKASQTDMKKQRTIKNDRSHVLRATAKKRIQSLEGRGSGKSILRQQQMAQTKDERSGVEGAGPSQRGGPAQRPRGEAAQAQERGGGCSRKVIPAWKGETVGSGRAVSVTDSGKRSSIR